MRPRRSVVVAAAFLALVAIPGRPCGPFFPEAIFVTEHLPENFKGYVAGNLGVVENTYWKRYLVPAYRVLAGVPLTPDEQEQMVAANGREDASASISQQPEQAWAKARSAAGAKTKFENVSYFRGVPGGNQWQQFQNCFDDAFRNATKTLHDRQKKYPAAGAEIAEWIRGQDAVFSNCDKTGTMPGTVASNSPLWLQQDRAYQIAAAHFYRTEWNEADEGFRSIAADNSSSWRELAQYLRARVAIRQASITEVEGNGPTSEQLVKARDLLLPVAQGKGPYADDAQALLTYVLIRTDPEKAALMLAERLSHPDANAGQDWIDLNWIVNLGQWNEMEAKVRSNDMIDWMVTMQANATERPAEYQHALARWQTTKSMPWLVAAMSLAEAPADVELLRAAKTVPESSPAYLTLAVHRLRLSHDPQAAYAEAGRIIAAFQATAPRSAINHLRQVQRTNASTLHEFLKAGPSVPAIYTIDNSVLNLNGQQKYEEYEGPFLKARIAGEKVLRADGPRFDLQTAAVLNLGLPLKSLEEAVLTGGLPRQLRFELAQATWTRAVLLKRPEIAAKMTPILIAGEPAWKPWLEAYDNANTVDERTYAGLMAIMRYPSTRPYVNTGGGRDDGFAGYSYYRDNWWCDARTPALADGAQGYTFRQHTFVAFPYFLTSQARNAAEVELHAMDHPEGGSDRIAKEAITWAKTHPKDPRSEELLGFTFRTLRNGCSGNPWREDPKAPKPKQEDYLEYQVFTLLHRNYPNSVWAKKYKAWDLH